MDRVIRVLRRAALQGEAVDLSDRQLLERFLSTREEAAFEAIVCRHGPMVLNACRRVLDHAQDAEDAFQATFLVLACKASTILTRATMGNWLYGVAYRTAQKARAAAARRRVKEKHMTRPEAFSEPDWHDLRPLLDQELSSLPDTYREPLILCDLQGITRKAAAQQLGWSEGTLSGRLSRARELLAKRLKRCGVTLSVAALAGALSTSAASAFVPAPLIQTTTQAAASVAAGQAVAGVVSAPVAALTKGVLKAMFMTKLKTVSCVLLVVGLIALGTGVSLTQQPGLPPPKAEGGADAKADTAPKFPKGMPPFQVLVSLNKDSKLTVKGRELGYFAVIGGPGGGIGGPGANGPGGGGPGAKGPAGGGAGGGPAGGGAGLPGIGGGGAGGPGGVFGVPPGGGTAISAKTYDLKDVKLFNTKGKQIDTKDLAKLLKEETVAVAVWGQAPDQLHLRILREDILIFVLPTPQLPAGPGGLKVIPGGLGGGAAPSREP